MHEPETVAFIPAWNAKKLAQWARALASGVTGLQLVRHGQGQSHFMLVRSTDDFYEGIVLGQLPQRQMIFGKDDNGEPALKPVPEKKKSPQRRSIDLSDGELDQVLARWARDESAFDLPFITAVHLRDGNEQRK